MAPKKIEMWEYDEVKRMFSDYVDDNFKSGSAAARHYKVTKQFIEQVIKGKYPKVIPNPEMAKDIKKKRKGGCFVDIEEE